MIYLDLEDALRLADQNLGGLKVRDLGLLDSALHRPRSEFAGVQAYPTPALKAAALLHSMVKNHAMFDGNKRLAWLCTMVFLDINGYCSELDHAQAYDLVVMVASTTIEIEFIADGLKIAPR